MNIDTIINLIDAGEYNLPQFQRGYVWNREQVRRFMTSLYRKNPVGSLLIWVTTRESAMRGVADHPAHSTGPIKLIVDGQQRITTLYGIVRGKAPNFFDGNDRNFLNLYFNLDSEQFEFYGPIHMRNNPNWVSVTEVLQKGTPRILAERHQAGLLENFENSTIEPLTQLGEITKKVFHIEEITDKSLEEVVDIFNEVNSGGTKLSQADLTLAQISARRPSARDEIKACLQKWGNAGYWFSMEWFLRGVTTTLTGDARFRAIAQISSDEFHHGVQRYEKHVDEMLMQIRAHLGLDHGSVLRSPFSLSLIARYLEIHADRSFQLRTSEIARILFWYIHTLLWGRYSGATESTLRRDLNILKENDTAAAQIQGLIDALQSERGTLELTPMDFHSSWSRNRFYPLLYLLTRVCGARDFCKNIPLSMDLLGNPLERHHIFPRAQLYRAGRSRRDVHRLANFAFLTMDCNRSISDRLPRDYFAEYETKHPGVLTSQWIPMDERLWEIENYGEFLEWRQERLAKAANQLLQQLKRGELPHSETSIQPEIAQLPTTPHIANDEELRQIQACQEWMREMNLPSGTYGYELVDEETGEFLATLDLAWPQGIQAGRSQAVSLLVNEDDEMHNIVQQRGYRYYTNFSDFKKYVEEEILIS